MCKKLISRICAFACLAVALMVVSCVGGRNRHVPTEHEVYAASLTAADTAEVIARAKAVVEKIISGDVEGALSGLGYVESDTLYPISSERIAAAANQFRKLGMNSASLENYTFENAENNTVKFRVSCGSSDGELFSTAFALNALKLEGAWYLTLKQ